MKFISSLNQGPPTPGVIRICSHVSNAISFQVVGLNPFTHTLASLLGIFQRRLTARAVFQLKICLKFNPPSSLFLQTVDQATSDIDNICVFVVAVNFRGEKIDEGQVFFYFS